MFVWRVVATNTITGKQVVSDWYTTEIEAEEVMRQMSLEPTYLNYTYIIERKAV